MVPRCIFAGATVDYKDGFVGCMRALMANGKILNLKEKVERGDVTYGVETGRYRGVFHMVFL